MRMIESVDSVVARSSEDLWAEICSCLPHPDQKDAGDAFTDSFLDSCTDGGGQGSGSGGSSQTDPKPWAPLHDSEVYLASLGECLVRLQFLRLPRCLVAPTALCLWLRPWCHSSAWKGVWQLFHRASDAFTASA